MDGQIESRVLAARNYFSSGKTHDYEFRIRALTRLKHEILAREDEILAALKADMHKPDFEAYTTEIGMALSELGFVLKRLKRWMKPRYARTPLSLIKSSSRIYPVPYGVVLILAPWNYPFQLVLNPLIGAIAAGNCAVVKPSAYAPHTADVIASIIEACYKSSGFVSVITGGREENRQLLAQKFDYIFFTGSTHVGREVMAAAAKHLTPVSLELGGKSPCIVDDSADIPLAAKRIVWGKFLNAGQTCVAPDYVLVDRVVKDEFMAAVRLWIDRFYGENGADYRQHTSIINEKHFTRLKGLIERASGQVVVGTSYAEESRHISPTVIDNVRFEDEIMQEEIFGPILPVITYDDMDAALAEINSREKPLALYLFTRVPEREELVRRRVRFGGGCVNDTVMHVATPHLPFGGVGASGMGAYHGKYSFETFSHKISLVKKSNLFDIPLRYPPHDEVKLKSIKKFIK